ncbi:MAG TPA: OmpA family protein [Kineosporiaceae bacterium]
MATTRTGTAGRSGDRTWVAILLVVAFVGAGSAWSALRIQDHLTARSRAALRAAGIPVAVRYDGRDAVLSGAVGGRDQATAAVAVVAGVGGTRRVRSGLATGPVEPPAVAPGVGSALALTSSGPASSGPSSAAADSPPRGLSRGSVLFAVGDATLSAAARAYLDGVALFLAGHPAVRVAIQGHSDADGPGEPNVVISRRRAEVVAGYLVGRHVESNRLDVQALGATDPVASNDSPQGRAANRRVDLVADEGAR